MFLLSVDWSVQKYTYAKVADLDFINKTIIELIFKLNIPFMMIFYSSVTMANCL